MKIIKHPFPKPVNVFEYVVRTNLHY